MGVLLHEGLFVFEDGFSDFFAHHVFGGNSAFVEEFSDLFTAEVDVVFLVVWADFVVDDAAAFGAA